MILRAAIVFLLVLNLGVAAWWIAGGNAPPERGDTPVPANAPSLRLLREAGPRPPAAAVAAAPVVSTAADAPPAAAAPEADPGLCLRFGPFADVAARDAARPLVASASAELRPRDMPAKPARGWMVHIPPFATRDEAAAMGEKIKSAGVSDWYVMNEGDAANSIALGRYGSEDAARRREAELKAKGIPAQAEALGDTAPQWWLDARLKPGADLASLVGAGPSKRIDCVSLR